MTEKEEKEEAIQKALGILPQYRISIFGPRGGLLGKYSKVIDALTPIHAIYYSYSTLYPSHRTRFLRLHRLSWKDYRSAAKHCRIVLHGFDEYTMDIWVDPRLILDVNGDVRKDIPKEILDKSTYGYKKR